MESGWEARLGGISGGSRGSVHKVGRGSEVEVFTGREEEVGGSVYRVGRGSEGEVFTGWEEEVRGKYS